MARTYVEGNTVRKLNNSPAAAARRAEDRARELRERRQRQIQRNQQKALNVDIPYLIVLVIASVCTLTLCFNYIQLQTTITARITSIEKKEQTLDKLKSENDALQNSIDTKTDLQEVYKIATQELGMVYPGQDQVIKYDKTESEYVRQYEDIPKY